MCKAQSAEAVPNCCGTRDQFCGRQFLDGLGTGRVILGMSQAHYVYFAFIPIIITSATPQIIRH